ncbi:hypothetical protein D3C81_2046060 [compost metagenome]
MAAGIDHCLRIAVIEINRARCCIPYSHRICEDLFHSFIGNERFAFLHTDGGHETGHIRAVRACGLFLNDLVQLFVEFERISVNGVHLFAG